MKHPPPIVRNEHLIDRHLVVFDERVGGHCVCKEFAMARECRHTREGDGRRAAQVLIANRVRSIHGALTGFSHHEPNNDSAADKRTRSRSLALVRVR